jgi:hypothetical protein
VYRKTKLPLLAGLERVPLVTTLVYSDVSLCVSSEGAAANNLLPALLITHCKYMLFPVFFL